MITEQGSIKVSTAIDGNTQKDFSRKQSVLALTCIIIGAIGVGIFFVLYILSEFFNIDESMTLTFLILFAAILGGGIGLKITLKRALKTVAAAPKVNEYEFFKDYFTVDQIMNGENVAHAKVYVNQITKFKENDSFMFLYIGVIAYPVSKTGLTETELATLRMIFSHTANGSTVTLASAPAEVQSIQPIQPERPEDPFDEFKN